MTEAELFLQKLPTQRKCIQVLYSRVTTRAYSTQDVWTLSWPGPQYCLLCTGKAHYYKAASTECIAQGRILQDPKQNLKVGVFRSPTLCGSPYPLPNSINSIVFHLQTPKHLLLQSNVRWNPSPVEGIAANPAWHGFHFTQPSSPEPPPLYEGRRWTVLLESSVA